MFVFVCNRGIVIDIKMIAKNGMYSIPALGVGFDWASKYFS